MIVRHLLVHLRLHFYVVKLLLSHLLAWLGLSLHGRHHTWHSHLGHVHEHLSLCVHLSLVINEGLSWLLLFWRVNHFLISLRNGVFDFGLLLFWLASLLMHMLRGRLFFSSEILHFNFLSLFLFRLDLPDHVAAFSLLYLSTIFSLTTSFTATAALRSAALNILIILRFFLSMILSFVLNHVFGILNFGGFHFLSLNLLLKHLFDAVMCLGTQLFLLNALRLLLFLMLFLFLSLLLLQFFSRKFFISLLFSLLAGFASFLLAQ